MDYPGYLDRMIVEIANRQGPDRIRTVALAPIHHEIFSTEPRSWLESLASELHRQCLGADWQSSDNLHFHTNGALFARAAEIRRASTDAKAAVPKADWGKWGAIAGIVALPLTILLWWFS
jgi:hypothetical protein